MERCKDDREMEILRRVVGEIGPCPAGCAKGMQVYPHLQRQDGRCGVCHGVGMVSLIPCRCGRPRRFDAVGLVEGVVFCCGRKECGEKMKGEKVKGRRVVGVVVESLKARKTQLLLPCADDRAAWYDIYTQGMGELD